MRYCRSTCTPAAMRGPSPRPSQSRTDRAMPGRAIVRPTVSNHIETYKDTAPAFPQLELIQPHAQRAFDLLVNQVEQGDGLPPDQCIPRGGAIASSPAQPGHCADLFV